MTMIIPGASRLNGVGGLDPTATTDRRGRTPARRRPMRVRALLLAGLLAAGRAGPAASDQVQLSDGRILEGRFALLTGVAVDPFAEEAAKALAEPILVCDDGLTRTMVAKRRVVRTDKGSELGMERLLIPQRVAQSGRRVVGIGAGFEATPFDEFGRRILSLATASGRVDVVQGITEITPRWIKLEGLQTEKPIQLDMRVATTAVPVEVIRRIIDQGVDRRDGEQRLRIVRLLMQAERYEEAQRELDGVVADFPELADLGRERSSIARLASTRLLDEIRLRGLAGQDRLAIGLLEEFPTDDTDGEVLEAVREEREAYRARRTRAAGLVAALRTRLQELPDPADQAAAAEVIGEIERELTFASLPRLATFERLGREPDTGPQRSLALAIGGWLGIAGADNLKLALSAVRVRDLLRDYLRTVAVDGGHEQRRDILARLQGEEAAAAGTIASLAATMRPPLEAPPEIGPGLHELTVDGSGGRSVRCLVQLPPEYDPLRRYPAVLSLHGAGSAPLRQIEWWAGMPGPDGSRRGQATRHGTIVIAPAWAGDQQANYGWTAEEHAAVLSALRAAIRCFSIDTDRVFLSGHAMGGDAAWDIALAHPDLWAGLVAVAPAADRYVTRYWRNASTLPIYLVGGELDARSLKFNAVDLDRYFSKGFDTTYVEYRGRGHEHFSDEILRIFDWMGRKRRSFFPASFEAVSMRPWDRFFWWVEMESAPPRTMVLPVDWPPSTGTRPLLIEAKTGAGNSIAVRCGAERVRILLSPELVDFGQPLSVMADGRAIHKGPIVPDLEFLLEDLRLRGDRQHPFWAMAETIRGPRRAP
jgi:predicted esterase